MWRVQGDPAREPGNGEGEDVMADRMRRVWAPIDTGVLTLPANGDSYALVNSELEQSLDRSVRQFTVTRVIAKVYVAPQITNDVVYLFHGVRIENENVPVGTVNPIDDQDADWILHGTVWNWGEAAGWDEAKTVNIDNRSQRKSQGEQSELRWYMSNGGGNGLYVAVQGRALLLLP